jgi:hypothetical protein
MSSPFRGAAANCCWTRWCLMQRDEVDRAVFIATPHRGSNARGKLGRPTASRLVRLPTYLTDVRNDVSSVLVADAAGLQLNFAPNSIDTLNPNNRFVREVNRLPVSGRAIPFDHR